MTEPPKTAIRVPPAQPRQICLTFESTGLLGLSTPERKKALAHLAHLLLLAAGVADKEENHER